MGETNVTQTCLRVNSKECSDVRIVGQCSTEADDTNHRLRRLNLTDRSGDQYFDNGPSRIMQDMDLEVVTRRFNHTGPLSNKIVLPHQI